MKRKTTSNRRQFILHALQLVSGLALAGPIESLASIAKQPMSFYHTHTGERFRMEYSCNGCNPTDLKQLNNFLRDFRTGEVFPIDQALLDILYGIQQKSGSSGVIEIISGFRSPQTNKLLRSGSSGVAKKSLHMKGKALDIRLTDLETKDLQKTAISLRKGGVGYYAKSDFVHIDTGRFRTW